MPRVHYNHLELVQCHDYDEGEWHLRDTPFTGIAWEELRGCRSEDSMLEGKLHGRCVRFHANGQMAFDGRYQNGDEVGDHFEWYDSGVLKSCSQHDASAGGESLVREYNGAGSLIKESGRKGEKWTLRHWHDDGTLLFEHSDDVGKCYAPDGTLAIREFPDRSFEFSNETLYLHGAEMLKTKNGLVESPFFVWLHQRLDDDDPQAKQLLFQLIDHPVIETAETAMGIVGNRCYREATELIRRLTQSKRKKLPDSGGYVGTTAELAERVLIQLTVAESEQEARLQQFDLRQSLAETRRERDQARQRKLERRQWPQTTAHQIETLQGETTIKSGEQILTKQFVALHREFVHLFEYQVDGRTYRAIVTNRRPSASKSIQVRYRPDNPAENVVITFWDKFWQRLISPFS